MQTKLPLLTTDWNQIRNHFSILDKSKEVTKDEQIELLRNQIRGLKGENTKLRKR